MARVNDPEATDAMDLMDSANELLEADEAQVADEPEPVEQPKNAVPQELLDSITDRDVRMAGTGKANKPYQVIAKAATLIAVVRDLGINKKMDARKQLARALDDNYAGSAPEGDHETDVAVEVTSNTFNAINESFERLGLNLEEIPYEAPANQTAGNGGGNRRERATINKPKAVIPEGYGNVERGTWHPGYDAKYKSVLLKRVDQGDQAAADEMVSRNWSTPEKMTARIHKAQAVATAKAAKDNGEDAEQAA